MSESTVVPVVFLTGAVMVSLGAHLKLKSFGMATLVSTALPPLLLVLIQFPRHGHSETWVPITLLFSSVYALGISLFIGAAIGIVRKWAAGKKSAR